MDVDGCETVPSTFVTFGPKTGRLPRTSAFRGCAVAYYHASRSPANELAYAANRIPRLLVDPAGFGELSTFNRRGRGDGGEIYLASAGYGVSRNCRRKANWGENETGKGAWASPSIQLLTYGDRDEVEADDQGASASRTPIRRSMPQSWSIPRWCARI